MLSQAHQQQSKKLPSIRLLPFVLITMSLILSWTFAQGCGPVSTNEANKEDTTKSTKEKAIQEVTEEATKEVVVEKKEEKTATPDEPTAQESTTDGGAETTKPDTQESFAEVKPELPVETKPELPPGDPVVAYIMNSDFKKGSLALMTINNQKLVKEWTQIATAGDITGDVALKIYGKNLFIINRGTGDIIVLDTSKKFSKKATVAVGKINPHDVVVVGTKMYVSIYDRSEIKVYEENKKTISIDLDSLAETSTKKCTKDADCTKFGAGSNSCNTSTNLCLSDGIAELDFMFTVGPKLYVAAQGLDRNSGYTPIKSSLAVIDTTSDKLVNTIALKGTNPVGAYKEPSGTYLIAEAGSSLKTDDGGLERFDPKTGKMSGTFIITEKELGGNIASVVVVSKTLAYAVINDASYKQSLVQFDPSTGKKGKSLLTGKSLGSIALTSQGKLLLSDKGTRDTQGKYKDFGVRIFEASSGKELTSQPIPTSTTLPPTIIRVSKLPTKDLP